MYEFFHKSGCHCLGQGTVLTGTCLAGEVSINDKVEIANISLEKKIKSIQVFKKPVNSIRRGDRAGLCVTQFDSSLLERGIVSFPGVLKSLHACIIALKKVRFYKSDISSNQKFHIVAGYEVVMGKITLFSSSEQSFSPDSPFEFLSNTDEPTPNEEQTVFASIQFERPVLVTPQVIFIGSKLDSDVHFKNCRLAFYGSPVFSLHEENYATSVLPNLKVFKKKSKEGRIERIFSDDVVICKHLLKKESSIEKFIHLKVVFSTGHEGVIIGTFGQGGKVKVQIKGGVSEKIKVAYPTKKGRKQQGDGPIDDESEVKEDAIKVVLNLKKFIFTTQSKIVQ